MKNCNGTFISLNAFSFNCFKFYHYQTQLVSANIFYNYILNFFCQQALRDSKHVLTVNEALINFTVYDECLF